MFTFSARFHFSISPKYLSGRVDRYNLKVKPKIEYTWRRKSRQPSISDSTYGNKNIFFRIIAGVQMFCERNNLRFQKFTTKTCETESTLSSGSLRELLLP